MLHWRVARALAVAAILVGGSASPALAATPAECVAAAERAQTKRDDGHLIASRVEFVACAADSCPTVVKRECLRWLSEVDERIPSLQISVKERSGKDVLGAEVTVDGVAFPQAGTGRAVQLDPGPHKIRAKVAGREPIDEAIIARERERDRIVVLALPASPSAAVERERDRTHDTASEPAAPRRGVPVLSWVLGGVAVVGVGAFAYFWSSGTSRVSDLRDSCSPFCTSEQIDDARVPLTTARIALGVGIAAGIGAVIVYLVQPSVSSARAAPPARIGMRPGAPSAFAF